MNNSFVSPSHYFFTKATSCSTYFFLLSLYYLLHCFHYLLFCSSMIIAKSVYFVVILGVCDLDFCFLSIVTLLGHILWTHQCNRKIRLKLNTLCVKKKKKAKSVAEQKSQVYVIWCKHYLQMCYKSVVEIPGWLNVFSAFRYFFLPEIIWTFNFAFFLFHFFLL